MSSLAEETRQKILTAMNKLGHVPNRNLPSRSPNGHSSVGQKRPASSLEWSSKGDNSKRIDSSLSQTPQCRPWDREDLIKRLSTFKAMTWFAKPKLVDAVSCATRGWINVDFDTLACEVCGARLLFSNPAFWNRQQVEKAALVFMLKLNSGHKLNCPWMDNACDESLLLFPPTPSNVLVDQYRERSSALLQLSALPLVSPAAIETMRSPQLEQFLKDSVELECGKLPSDSSLTDELGNDSEASSAALYYQAHKVLSLCGWEPCSLPYTVDCNGQSKTSIGSGTSSSSSSRSHEDNRGLIVYNNSQSQEKTTTDEQQSISSSTEYDPNSTVLDCKLCGARAGLWNFSTVPKPLQLARVVGYSEPESTVSKEVIPGKGNTESLRFTIAGGPPPTRQSSKVQISLPIVGRNLNAQLASVSSYGRHFIEERCSSDSVAKDRSRSSEIEITSLVNERAPDTVDENRKSCQVTDAPGAQAEDSTTVVAGGQSSGVTANGGQVEGGGSDAHVKNSLSSYIADPRPSSCDNKVEFDPIRLHRHFCPWVVSMNTTAAPGWKQTLVALQKEKVFSVAGSEDSPSVVTSPSLIKVDDPITSIRRLFKSPPAKRMKSSN